MPLISTRAPLKAAGSAPVARPGAEAPVTSAAAPAPVPTAGTAATAGTVQEVGACR